MTSPYIEREAAKLHLVHSAPPPDTSKVGKVGSLANHDRRDFHYSRSQREAGVEHLEWEERLPVIRPWMFFAISAACWVVLALAIAWTCAAL